MTGLDLSIVLPAKNEQASIVSVLDDLAQHVPGAEILLVCDNETDATIGAAQTAVAAKAKLALQIVICGQGGVTNAVRAGVAKAKRRFIAFWTADGADEAVVLALALAILRADQADLVCPSRFMAGGRMIGAPKLKGFLSRIANGSLFHIFRMPVSDSTNTFLVCSTANLNRIPIETASGFAYGLEIKAKARRLGLRMQELPTTWRERQTGVSNFRIWAWLPQYLRWYVLAASAGRKSHVRVAGNLA